MGFGVVGHDHGHIDVARVVHIGVAIAIQVLDDGHFGLSADALDQALAATRNDHVHKLRHGDELAYSGAVGGLHQLHGLHRQTAVGQGFLHQKRQRLVRLDGLRATAQDAGVAAFDGEAGRFDGHVGSALENHAKHANGHPHLAHADATGHLLHADDFADHVGHGGQLLAALGAGFQHLGGQFQAVHHRLGQSGGAGALQVFGVVQLQGIGALAQQGGQMPQSLVFGGSRGFGHQGRGRFGLQAQGLHVFSGVQFGHGYIFAEAKDTLAPSCHAPGGSLAAGAFSARYKNAKSARPGAAAPAKGRWASRAL